MGFFWTRDVYEAYENRPDVDKIEMAILVAIAFCMNDRELSAFPSVTTLSKMTHIGRSAIFDRLNGMQSKGLLTYASGGYLNGRTYANVYTIRFPPDFKPKPREGFGYEAVNAFINNSVDNSVYNPDNNPVDNIAADAINATPPSAARTTPSATRTTPVRRADYPPVRTADTNKNIKQKYNINLTGSAAAQISDTVLKSEGDADIRILGRSLDDVRKQPVGPVGQLMDFCRTSSQKHRIAFSRAGATKGTKAIARLLDELKGQRKKGELKHVKNMSDYVLELVRDLPDV